MPLNFSSSFAVVPYTHLLRKLSAYILSDRCVSWLCCYKISGYVLSESTVFIWYTLKCFLVFPKDLSFCLTYWFIILLCNSIKNSKYLLLADTIEIACSISSAIDSTLPQCYWFFCVRFAADFMELDTDKSKVTCTMLTMYCLNQTKCWDSYLLWPTLLLQLNIPYCYITPQLVLSKNMPHLPAVTLWLLMPICRNTSNRSLQLYASVFFFHYAPYNYTNALYLLMLHTLWFRKHQIDSHFFFMLLHDQNFVLPW